MFFNEISQGELVNIIEQMESKSSLDINGLSTKFIKFLKFELATPLVHLFHLSIRGGKFPSKLKATVVGQYLYLKQAIKLTAITTDPSPCLALYPKF